MEIKRCKISNLSFKYLQLIGNREKEIFKKSNLIINNKCGGAIISVMGASGCGKTTLLKLMVNDLKPTCGKITFDGTENCELHPTIAYLSQEPVYFNYMSLYKNLTFFEKIKSQSSFYREDILDETLEILNISDYKDKKSKISINELSGGEKQRIVLARALSIRPNLLLLDEPCTGFDTITKINFLLHLKKIVNKYEILVFYVTHHPDEAKLISDKILYFNSNIDKGITLVSVKEAIIRPPSIEICHMMTNDKLIKFPCQMIDNIIYLNNIKLFKVVSSDIKNDEYTFVVNKNHYNTRHINLESHLEIVFRKNFGEKIIPFSGYGYLFKKMHNTGRRIEFVTN